VSASGSPAPRGATASDRGPVQHVVFLVDTTRYAIPLAAVREIVVQPDGLVRVPRAPVPVLGVVNLRGRVVTVVDFPLLKGVAVTVLDADALDGAVTHLFDRG